MTAILSPSDLPETLSTELDRSSGDSDAIRRELLSLRSRVRALAEDRARSAAEEFIGELRVLTREAVRSMAGACESRAVLSRLHHRLARQVNSDLLRGREDDEDSMDARARALLLAQLETVLDSLRTPGDRGGSSFAGADLTPGATRALRVLGQHRETVRVRIRALKSRLQTELADLSLEMAGETAARLCLRHGQQGREWLSWRLGRIVDQFVAIATPASLPASLELLATRSVLLGLEMFRGHVR